MSTAVTPHLVDILLRDKYSSLADRALIQYMGALPEAKRTVDFFYARFWAPYSKSGATSDMLDLNLKDINDEFRAKAREGWGTTLAESGSKTKGFLKGFVDVQRRFDAMANNLVSMDPTPISQTVWSCISVLAEAVDHYYEIPEAIATALEDLKTDLGRITDYDKRISRGSPRLQEVFCEAYRGFFSFWGYVYQHEFPRRKISRALIAFSGISHNKLDKLIGNMQKHAQNVKDAINEMRQEHADWTEQETELLKFLEVKPGYNVVNSLKGARPTDDEYSDWIFDNLLYNKWETSTSSGALWLYGPPGCGKSTLCLRVAKAIQTKHPLAAVATYFFHFYDSTPMLDEVLKSLVYQLWSAWKQHHPLETVDGLDVLQDLVNDGKHRGTTERAALMLSKLVKALSPIYILIDGVDELEEALPHVGTACWYHRTQD